LDCAALLRDLEEKMKKSLEATSRELRTIRSSRADASLIEHVRLDYYGQKLAIPHLATVTVPDARTILITPWDKSIIQDLERALSTSDLGLTPTIDGQTIRIAVPPLSQERRAEFAKIVAKRGEEGKVALRNLRRDCNEKVRRLQKEGQISEDQAQRAEEKIQELTQKYIAQVDALVKAKQQDLMKV